MRDDTERVHWGDTPLLLLDPRAPPDALKWRLEFTGPQTLRVTALTDDREAVNGLYLERWGSLVVVEAAPGLDGPIIQAPFAFLRPLLAQVRALRRLGYGDAHGPPWLVHTETVAPMLHAIGQSELAGRPGACEAFGVKLAWAPELDRYVRCA